MNCLTYVAQSFCSQVTSTIFHRFAFFCFLTFNPSNVLMKVIPQVYSWSAEGGPEGFDGTAAS